MNIFVTGGTGFMGRRLTEALLNRGHAVDVLVRPGSEKKVPAGARTVSGNPLDGSSYREHLRPDQTFVQLVGVSHPSPWRGDEFQKIDFTSGKEAVEAARIAGIRHFVYVSVAQPAPIMQAYVQARAEVEARVRSSGMNGTILRPWYVLGPGRRWPVLLLPLYWIASWFAITRTEAQRLGLVTVNQMVKAMVAAIENPPEGISVVEVPEINLLK